MREQEEKFLEMVIRAEIIVNTMKRQEKNVVKALKDVLELGRTRDGDTD